MLALDLTLAPRWIDLMPGVAVEVRPMSHAIWLAAQADAAVQEAEAERDSGAWTFLIGLAVARLAITDWRGVGDLDGNVLPVSPDGITALMHQRHPFDAFFDAYLGPWMALAEEKKGLAPLSDGSSETGPSIAATAKASATPAPGG